MSNNLKNIFLFLTFIGLCSMINCKLDTDKEVAPIDETKIYSTSKLESKSEANDIDIESPKIESQPKEGVIQNTDSLTNNKPSEKENISSDIKTQEENNSPPSVKKKPKKKVAKRAAKIDFKEVMWNFGEIVEGNIIKKKFIFTNAGNAPLQILGTDASCGCARPTVPFLDIAPGDSSEIGITYNSVNKDGAQEPEIIIESNTLPRYTVIKLFGTVKPKSKIEKNIDLDSVKIKQDTIAKN